MLSAICRLQSWKWIGAVLAVAAAGAATAAPDITDRLQNLGIPLIGRYPDGQITQSTYARNVWDMKLHAGRVFIGSGNSANTGPSPNAGPAQVWEIDPATGTSQFSYQIGGEQADLFRVFGDGCLYVPDHDPPGTSSYNCYYKRNLSGVWNKGGWVQGEVHVYDMAEFDGKMFACGYYLWRSDDGGATWYRHGTHSGRNYAFLPYGDQLMTSTSYYNWNSGDVFRYWNKATQTWAVPDAISAARAFPDQSNLPGNYLKLVRPAQFGNKCLYIGAYEFNDHQNDPFGAYVSTFNGTTFSATAIPAATGEVPWDILVKDGTAYLLVQDRTLLANTDRRYVNRVFASTDAASWTELFSFRATTFAISFEKVGDTFYFGMGTKDRVCDECGTIYRVNPGDGPATVNFSALTQTVQEDAVTVSVPIVLSKAAASAVSIPFTLGGTALAGADYQIPASPLTIPAGQTSGTIDIVLAADGLAEPAETIIVVLGTPTGATLGATTTHTLTIAASEAAPQADYNAIPYRESFEGARWNDRPLPAALAPAPGWRVPSSCGAVVAATGRYAYTGRRPIPGGHENILLLDPSGATITNRLDPAHDLSAAVLHVDAMVSFEAAGEASPLGGANGTPKIGLYVNSQGRLCILHSRLDDQGDRSAVVETETGAIVPTNGWCRLSVAFDATVEPGGTLPAVEMFCVRIDGEIVRSPAAYSDSWSTDWSAGRLPQPSPGGVWFPSADKSAQSRALGGLVLKGSGKIDDLCVVEEDPFLGMGERALLLLR